MLPGSSETFFWFECIYSKKIINNDLKPLIIIVKSDGGALIIDFGIAAQFDTPLIG